LKIFFVTEADPTNPIKIRHFEWFGEVEVSLPTDLLLDHLSGHPDWDVFETEGQIIWVLIVI